MLSADKPQVGLHGDATALASAIARSGLTAKAAMEAALAAAERDKALGALAIFLPSLGLEEADAVDGLRETTPEAVSSPPFAGVPCLAKDLGGPFAGIPVHAGSRALADHTDAAADSDLARRFRKAGFCFFGSTTVPEFGLSLSGEPAMGPVCRNPLAPDRSAGGSSSGAAAAVAAGIVAIAHATDAGGSIRVPAACCGLVGLKPTRGMLPGGPDFGNHLGGIASEFAVCRSTRDAELALLHLTGEAKGPFADPGMGKIAASDALCVGVLTDTGDLPLDGDRRQAVIEAAATLEADGHRIVRLGWNAFSTMVRDSNEVFAQIVSVNLAQLFETLRLDPDKTEPLTRAFLERGRGCPATALWDALQKGVKVSYALWTLFEEIDVLLTPMLTSPPPLLGSFPTDHGDVDAHLERMAAFAPLATLANVSGAPALTLPFGADAEGLPLPVQLMAAMGGDRLLLTLAARLEREERWRQPFPVAGLTT
ncbi:amidase [Chelativorans salis]|uniref:Indoleacetamide hydrolase n=1 Tax=Chelativorans salis TaxID=2978478 RepID=A0ABT2LGI3_9HYPH|nr:amidase [Chelativorans sp. EGI FJ00035]MCT7373530.1 amidase [Chelativorans sp. EGI FJ00035]